MVDLVAIDSKNDTGLTAWPDGYVSGPDFFGRWPPTYPTFGRPRMTRPQVFHIKRF